MIGAGEDGATVVTDVTVVIFVIVLTVVIVVTVVIFVKVVIVVTVVTVTEWLLVAGEDGSTRHHALSQDDHESTADQ